MIFTSGSTGTPKGVAVSHRSAAAFVDAESRMFLQPDPLGDGDRVMAGLSVAFDASCEEMWLAWRYGACLVPAPRALVKSGIDVGPWLVANDVTVVSTVPTLVALWPPESLARVRLLIMGGEACPPELAARLVAPGREVWNTYGPTEATVVACGAELTGVGPVRIGLPLDGWDLAVVDGQGQPVPEGATGELIIGGVGLARYLDPVKDAEKYAPMPSLGWDRAYRSGDLVVNDPEGLALRRARGRPGQARRSPDRARRDRLGAARRARASWAPPRRCDGRPRATSSSSATSPRTRRSTMRRRWSCSATRCRPRWCPGSRRSTGCPRRRPARSTGTRCPGRCRPRSRTPSRVA